MMLNNKYLLIFITLGIALVALLYSPVGSPELYQSDNYLLHYPDQGVGLKGGLTNSPRKSPVHSSTTEDISTEDHPNHFTPSTGVSSISLPAFNSSTSINGFVQRKSKITQSSSANGSLLAVAGRGTKQDISGTSGTSIFGENPFSSDRQLIRTTPFEYTQPAGGTDPGTDPVGHALPLSDGLGVFILLICVYLFSKQHKQRSSKKPQTV